MLFQQLRPSNHLQVSLRAAIASHRPAALKIMFDHHGERVFAQALSGLSKRAVADALSMLPANHRRLAQLHLPKSLRHSCCTAPGLQTRCSSAGLDAHRPQASQSSALPGTASLSL